MGQLENLLPLPEGISHIQRQRMTQNLRSQDYANGIGYATRARVPENEN